MRLKKGSRLAWLLPPILALDQITKLATRGMQESQTVIPGILSWAHVRNPGAAFSIFSGSGILLILATLALIIGLILCQLRREDNPVLERIGFWCIIGGGIGNLIDRLIYGGVTDFIRLDFVNFAIFNVADIFVCCGAFLVVLSAFLQEHGRKQHG